jgi:hypothetical protein
MFFWLHTRCYSISQFLSALLLVTHIYQIMQQWVHFKPANLLFPLEQFHNTKIRTANISNHTHASHLLHTHHTQHRSTLAHSTLLHHHSLHTAQHTHPTTRPLAIPRLLVSTKITTFQSNTSLIGHTSSSYVPSLSCQKGVEPWLTGLAAHCITRGNGTMLYYVFVYMTYCASF